MRRTLMCVCLLTAAAGCQSASPGAIDRLHPCGIEEGPPEAFCGSYRVFENRAANGGRTIDLKVVIAPALKRDARSDPLFVFEGGPGGGAATLAEYRIPMFRSFQTDRDIVLIDQRGTGGSNPLDCQVDPAEDDDLQSIDVFPIERYRSCLERLNADPSFYTTAIAMDDVDDVRQWLGYERINLWGGSYGTRAALVFLHRHETAVRAVVLDGVAPPDMRIPLYMARDSQRALDRLLDDCERDEPGCARSYPHLRTDVARLWDTLAAKPHITVSHPRTGQPMSLNVSRSMIGAIVFQSLYTPEVTSLLPQLLTDAAAGSFQGLLALAYAADVPKGAMSDGLFLSVVCSEDIPRISAADIEQEAAGHFIGRSLFDSRVKPCEFWPRGVVDADFYEPVTSAKPVLIFSGENDPVTPPSWGEHVASALSNSRHVVVPGAGHIALMRGCVRNLVGTFLEQASTQGLEVDCVKSQKRPPFFTGYTGPGTHRD